MLWGALILGTPFFLVGIPAKMVTLGMVDPSALMCFTIGPSAFSGGLVIFSNQILLWSTGVRISVFRTNCFNRFQFDALEGEAGSSALGSTKHETKQYNSSYVFAMLHHVVLMDKYGCFRVVS